MKRYLTLEDGTTFVGEGFGAAADAVGELVFTTGMCGYIETLTDPSYAGQIVMQTFPMIGNYGIIPADFEGKCAVRGYVVHEWCDTPSNFRAAGDLDTYLKSVGIPGIAGIDTRALTRTLRECGTMNATITNEVPADLTAVKAYAVTDAVASVTCAAPTEYSADGETRCRVALLDFGAKRNIIRSLTARGCAVTVFPASTPAADILATAPDGVMLSNGPGRPGGEHRDHCARSRKLLGQRAGLRHLPRASADGACRRRQHRQAEIRPSRRQSACARPCQRAYLHHQPEPRLRRRRRQRCRRVQVRFVNANDGTCEGIDYPALARLLGAVPPRGVRRPARHRVSV